MAVGYQRNGCQLSVRFFYEKPFGYQKETLESSKPLITDN